MKCAGRVKMIKKLVPQVGSKTLKQTTEAILNRQLNVKPVTTDSLTGTKHEPNS